MICVCLYHEWLLRGERENLPALKRKRGAGGGSGIDVRYRSFARSRMRHITFPAPPRPASTSVAVTKVPASRQGPLYMDGCKYSRSSTGQALTSLGDICALIPAEERDRMTPSSGLPGKAVGLFQLEHPGPGFRVNDVTRPLGRRDSAPSRMS